MTWKYDTNKKEVRLHIKQQQVNNFQIPLTISWIFQSGAVTNKTVLIDKKESDFVFSLPEKPKKMIADPFTSLLFERKVNEIK